jgi:hypothetical protein
VVVVAVDSVFFQCARAIQRSKLWQPLAADVRSAVPTAGAILAALTDGALTATNTIARYRHASARRCTSGAHPAEHSVLLMRCAECAIERR